jgi:TonB family protein
MPRSPPARLPRRERPLARAGVAAVASLAMNLAAGAALVVAGAFRLPHQDQPAPVALAELSPDTWAANRAISAPAAAPPPEAPSPKAPAPSAAPRTVPPGQIVSVAPSPDARRPAAARFLAERDNTVAREVQYRGPVPDGPAPVAARPSAGAAGAQGIPLPGEEGSADEAAPGREGSRGTEHDAAARVAAARLALAEHGERPAPVLAGLPAAGDRRPGDGGARRLGRFDPRVLPVGNRFEGVGGGRPMADRLAGVAEGDRTVLNTRAFRYADFYRRVGEAIRSEWDPNRAWDALDPHDRAFGREARRVVVDIVLDRAGRLVDATVAGSSGLAFFDREALRAIAAAAPFPNPPAGLVGGDGRIVLEQFGLRFEWPEHALLDRLVRSKRP